MRKISYLVFGAAIGAAAVSFETSSPSLNGGAQAAASDVYRKMSLFGDVFDKVRADYVEKPDEGKMIEAAINGMLSSLDPHSSYMDANELPRHERRNKG